MRGANSRRRGAAADSFIPQQTPDNYRSQFTSRDSDASLASSRPSSVGMGGGRGSTVDLYTDRSYQSSAVRAINAYLASHSSNLSLQLRPISSSKDILEAVSFLLNALDYPLSKLEEDLPVVLKNLNCPLKFSKSTLRAPNSPHNWPSCLALIHWMVQLATYKEPLTENAREFVENDSMFTFSLQNYLSYLKGDDDAVEVLDRDFLGRLERERDIVAETVGALEKSCNELEAKLEERKVGPTEREKLEKEKAMLEEDVKKFEAMIVEFNQRIKAMEKVVEEKGKEAGVKLEEKKMIDEENEGLRKTVEEQNFNVRDAERMKRELQAVEMGIGESEAARSSWEEKTWELDASIRHKFKELEGLSMECNQAARRLKLGSGFQYTLNAKGSTPAEVMGIEYKSIIKPGLESFADDIKKSSMETQSELVSLLQQSSELTAMIEGKRNHLDALQVHIDEVEALLNSLRKDTEDYTSRCAAEAKQTLEDFQMETRDMDVLDREAAEVLKASKLKLQETKKQAEDEIQKYARELFKCVDTVSKYKEQISTKVSEMKDKLSKTAGTVSNSYKESFTAQFGMPLE